MKLCVKYRVNPTEEQEQCLNKLGFYATKLYNTDNYIRREHWDKTGKIPNWYEQKKLLRQNHWYRLLPSQTAQAIIKNLQDNYVSWFRLRKTNKDARPPMFRKKNKLSPLTFYQQFSMTNGSITVVMSRKFRSENGLNELSFDVKIWRDIKGIPKMCNIIKQGNKWMAHIVYEVSERKLRKYTNVMGVDLGIVNLIATADTHGNTKIYSGKQALAVQHYFNKEMAKVQGKSVKQHKKKNPKSISRMHGKKFRQINQLIHTATKETIKDAIKHKVGTMVIGDIKNIREGKHWRKKESQKLHSWSFAKLTSQLEYKAKQAGIRVVKVGERDTSKTCSICGTIKKSNRKHRGLYRCKCGNQINADINGALNILKKYLQENNISRSIGSVAEPLIWRCGNVVPS